MTASTLDAYTLLHDLASAIRRGLLPQTTGERTIGRRVHHREDLLPRT